MTASLQQELLQSVVDDYYTAMAEQQGMNTDAIRDSSKFIIDARGTLRLMAYPEVYLIKASGQPLKLNTIAVRRGRESIIRDELGFADWTRGKPTLPT